MVAAGTRVVTILDLSDVYMTIYLPAGQAGQLALGDEARIILDPFSHLLFSNKLDDNAPLDALLRQGLSIDDAITELLRRRGYSV